MTIESVSHSVENDRPDILGTNDQSPRDVETSEKEACDFIRTCTSHRPEPTRRATLQPVLDAGPVIARGEAFGNDAERFRTRTSPPKSMTPNRVGQLPGNTHRRRTAPQRYVVERLSPYDAIPQWTGVAPVEGRTGRERSSQN